jgi:hypothetical protein
MLVHRCENRDDAQAQAKPHHPGERVLMLMGSLKTRVVIELCVSRQPPLLPMGRQLLDRHSGRDRGQRPARCKTPMQRNAIQNLDVYATFDDEAFHHVKAVKLHLAACHRRQIPSRRWRWPANSTRPIQCATAPQNPTDCAHRGNPVHATILELIMNRPSTVLTKNTELAKLSANPKDRIFHVPAHPRRPTRCRRSALPNNSIEPLARGASQPVLNRRQRHAILARHLTLATSSTYSAHHLPALPRRQCFFSLPPPTSKRK